MVLPAPDVKESAAPEPMAVALLPVNAVSAESPTAVLWLAQFAFNEYVPTAVFEWRSSVAKSA